MSRACPHCQRKTIPELTQLPHLVVQREAAEVLGVSTSKLADWLNDPDVPLHRHHSKRIRRVDLEAFLGPPSDFVPGPLLAMKQRLECPPPPPQEPEVRAKEPEVRAKERRPRQPRRLRREHRPASVGRTGMSGTAERILAGLFEIGIGREATWSTFAAVMRDQPGWGSASERSIRLSYEAVRGELLNAGAKVSKDAPRLESVAPRLLEALWPAA